MNAPLVAGALLLIVVSAAETLRGARVVSVRRALDIRRGPVGLRGLLLVGSAAALAVALLVGSEGQRGHVAGTPGTVMFVVDVSRSMLVADGAPDRMTEARLAASRILASLPGIRVGIVAFAANAHLVLPPTTDHQLVQTYLAALDPGSMTAQGSNLAGAIELAATEVRRADSLFAAVPRGLVVLSDGESFQEEARLEAALQEVRSQELAVHVAAVGSEAGGQVPGGGAAATSRADHKSLAGLARETGGVALLGDPRGLTTLIDRLQAESAERPESEDPTRSGSATWLAAIALALLLAESGVGATFGRLT